MCQALSQLASCNTLAIFKLRYNSRPRENRSSSDGFDDDRPHRPRLGHWRGQRALSAEVRHGDRRQDTWPSRTVEGAFAVTVTSRSDVTTWLLTMMPSGRATRSPDALSLSSILSCAVARQKENRCVGNVPDRNSAPGLSFAMTFPYPSSCVERRRRETLARRVDSLTAVPTASRRRGHMKTPSPRPRHIQGHSRHRATDVRIVPVQHDVRLHTISKSDVDFELGRGPGLEGILRPSPKVMGRHVLRA